jgi:hypothetical protein
MKSPPKQLPDPVARDMTEEFIEAHGGKDVPLGETTRAKSPRLERSPKPAGTETTK